MHSFKIWMYYDVLCFLYQHFDYQLGWLGWLGFYDVPLGLFLFSSVRWEAACSGSASSRVGHPLQIYGAPTPSTSRPSLELGWLRRRTSGHSCARAGHRKQEELSPCRRIVSTPDSSSTGLFRFQRLWITSAKDMVSIPVSSSPCLDAALTLNESETVMSTECCLLKVHWNGSDAQRIQRHSCTMIMMLHEQNRVTRPTSTALQALPDPLNEVSTKLVRFMCICWSWTTLGEIPELGLETKAFPT